MCERLWQSANIYYSTVPVLTHVSMDVEVFGSDRSERRRCELRGLEVITQDGATMSLSSSIYM